MSHTYLPHPEEHPEGVRLEGRTTPMQLFVMLLLALSASLAIAAGGEQDRQTKRLRCHEVSPCAEQHPDPCRPGAALSCAEINNR